MEGREGNVCLCTFLCSDVCIYFHVFMCRMPACVCTGTGVLVCKCVCVCVCVYVCVRVCVYVCMYA